MLITVVTNFSEFTWSARSRKGLSDQEEEVEEEREDVSHISSGYAGRTKRPASSSSGAPANSSRLRSRRAHLRKSLKEMRVSSNLLSMLQLGKGHLLPFHLGVHFPAYAPFFE